jgi:hypothetical protein
MEGTTPDHDEELQEKELPWRQRTCPNCRVGRVFRSVVDDAVRCSNTECKAARQIHQGRKRLRRREANDVPAVRKVDPIN